VRICKYFYILTFLLAALAIPARAQVSYTSPQTVDATIASNLPCTGAAQTFATDGSIPAFRNLGQTQHYISAAISGTATAFKAEIDGIDNAGNVFRISDVMEESTVGIPYTLTGSGRFPKIQIVVTCSPNTATFTLSYSGTSSTPNSNVGSYLLAQLDKQISSAAAANTNLTSTFQTPFANSAGIIVFQYGAGGPAGSTLQIQCTGNSTGINSQTFSLATPATNQVFIVSPGVCPNVTTTYTAGGASATTYGLEYIFFQPGSLATSSALNLAAAINTAPGITEKGARWSQLSAPAAGSQGTTSKAAGAAGVRHVADCVSYSAGAIAAPAATALTINVRDGASGGGTVIWSKTVTIPATAAPHYDQNFCGLNLIGTAATAMTLEFSAALASESESVTLTGYDVQ
jgi:hypothetical protein